VRFEEEGLTDGPQAFEKLDEKIKEAIAEVILKMDLKKLPVLPARGCTALAERQPPQVRKPKPLCRLQAQSLVSLAPMCKTRRATDVMCVMSNGNSLPVRDLSGKLFLLYPLYGQAESGSATIP
jgi:hypothetical protein